MHERIEELAKGLATIKRSLDTLLSVMRGKVA